MLNDIRKIWADTVTALKSAERHYALDENHAVHVELTPVHADPAQLKAHVMLYERIEEKLGDLVEVDWDNVDLDSLPARVLMRVVEIKSLVERWNLGEIPELPASTSPDFLADREARRLARRRMRRY